MNEHNLDELPTLFNPVERSKILIALSKKDPPCHVRAIAHKIDVPLELTQQHLRFLVAHKILVEEPPEFFRYREDPFAQLVKELVEAFLLQPVATAQGLAQVFSQEGVAILNYLRKGGTFELDPDEGFQSGN